MIEKMEKIYIYSLKDHTAGIMEDIIRCGVVQPEQTRSMLSEDTAEALAPGEEHDLSREENLLQRIRDSISALERFGGKRGILHKRPVVSYGELTDEKLLTDSISLCRETEKVIGRINELDKQMRSVRFRAESLMPWEGFDLPVDNMGTVCTDIMFCMLPEPVKPGDVCMSAVERGLAVHAEEVSAEKGSCYAAVLFLKQDEKDVRSVIGGLGGRLFSFEEMSGTFADNTEKCRAELEELEKTAGQEESALEQLASGKALLETASDALQLRIAYLSGQENFMNTEKVSIITGWIPASRRAELDEKLRNHQCFCEYEPPEPGEDPPVLMKNSRLVEPFGTVTEMYSLPNPYSIDTNWAIGLFFFIFFGMMLSDAGYGLVLLAGGFAGARFLDVGDGARRLLRMTGICGISTMFWGAVYGSWFGDAIPAVAETFFGKTAEIPKLIDPLNQPMTVLILSCVLGAAHLFTGMGIKAYIMIKRGDKRGALFDVGLWYILLAGMPLLLVPEPWNTAGAVMAIAGALGLVLTQGRHRPKLAGKIISGVTSLYGITGYFSDVLSYSRILALGLATGVVASVVNIMGTMAGGGIAGAMLFAAVFVFGHLLNLGINALGAYVHSARLQYVEFFGKYYEGGGRKFDPLKIETKYVRVLEEK